MDASDTDAIVSTSDLAPGLRKGSRSQVLVTMVSETLALARQERRFTIGNYDWSEPDYRQLLMWAGQMTLEPDEVIRRLLDERSLHWDEDGMHTESINWDATTFREGRIVKLNWDMDLLPITEFRWIEGLRIEYLRIVSETPMTTEYEESLNKLPTERRDPIFERSYWRMVSYHKSPSVIAALHLPLPELQTLICERLRAEKIDLSEVPRLQVLRCSGNRLAQLDLANVPMLQNLDCSRNWLTNLEFHAGQLSRVDCSGNGLRSVEDIMGPELVELDCTDNDIIEMNLRRFTKLQRLRACANHFEELDITPLTDLRELEFGNEGEDPEGLVGYPRDVRLIHRADQHFPQR